MIAGVDLNSFSVALCGFGRRGPDTLVKRKVKVTNRAIMLGELYALALDLTQPGDIVYVESPVVAGVRNIQSTIKISAAYGVVLAAIDVSGGRVVETPISSWKMHTVGKGNANKDEVTKWLYEHHPLMHHACAGDQDLIDASCIALYGLRMETHE